MLREYLECERGNQKRGKVRGGGRGESERLRDNVSRLRARTVRDTFQYHPTTLTFLLSPSLYNAPIV